MRKVKLKFLIYSFLLVMVFSSFPYAHAKAGFGDADQPEAVMPDDEDPGDPGGDPDAPIDSGVIFLIGAGVVYGLGMLYKTQKEHK